MKKSRTGAALDNVFRRTTQPVAPNQPEPEQSTPPVEQNAPVSVPATIETNVQNTAPLLEEPRPVGRPRQHREPLKPIPVPMSSTAIRFLDQLRIDIQTNTGAAIPRAGLIRAMVAAVAASGIDLTSTPSEEDLQRLLIERLTTKE